MTVVVAAADAPLLVILRSAARHVLLPQPMNPPLLAPPWLVGLASLTHPSNGEIDDGNLQLRRASTRVARRPGC